MLGFAIVDRQPAADATAVWLTSRIETTIVRNTNAVVIRHDDPDHDTKIRSLTTGRAVVLTAGTGPPLPFTHANRISVFDELLDQTAAQQERISQAVDDYARRKKAKLVAPTFPPVPAPAGPMQDEPQYRALAVANYVGEVWSAWLHTEEQRVRRTVAPKSGKTPWIMPEELNSSTIAAFPDGFADRVKPEPPFGQANSRGEG
ncbi:hypothetical protein [Nocardia cyriacigeorgica]